MSGNSNRPQSLNFTALIGPLHANVTWSSIYALVVHMHMQVLSDSVSCVCGLPPHFQTTTCSPWLAEGCSQQVWPRQWWTTGGRWGSTSPTLLSSLNESFRATIIWWFLVPLYTALCTHKITVLQTNKSRTSFHIWRTVLLRLSAWWTIENITCGATVFTYLAIKCATNIRVLVK